MKRMLFIAGMFVIAMFAMLIMASCGSDSGIIPAPTFKTVNSYNNIPSDFALIYEIRDENASPPYRLVLAIDKSGALRFELYEDTSASVDKTFENAAVSENDMLSLYNMIITNGYFSMDALYTTSNLTIPIEVIEVYGKSTDFRVEYHACPQNNTTPPVPNEFRKIIENFKNLASDYLESI